MSDAAATPTATESSPGWLKLAALLIVALVFAEWSERVLAILEVGISSIDALWFHGPIAAGFVQEGTILDLHFLDVEIVTAPFYPANSELLNAVGILLFDGRDVLSPLLGAGWLVLGLLAAWCFGRRFGVAPLTTIAAAVVFATPAMVLAQAGEPKNDAMALALFVASIALLVAAGDRRAGLAISGLAAGIALGTKLTMVAPVLALGVGVMAVAAPTERLRAGAAWGVPALLLGSVWFVRNLAHTGSPLPMVDIGPLPSIEPPQADTAFSVVHYLGNASIWDEWFLPGLLDGLGPLWPGIVGLAAAGLLLGAVASGSGLPRMLALVGITAFAAYLFTPYSAGGPEGSPAGFLLNVRYAAPSLLIGLMLLPTLPRFRGAGAPVLIGMALVVLAVGTQFGGGLWPAGHRLQPAAVFAALVGAALVVELARRRGIGRTLAMGGLAAALATLVLAAYPKADHFVATAYTSDSPPAGWRPFALAEVFSWARQEHDQRIAIGGTIGSFYQYPLFGIDFSNEVQRVGQEGEHGSFAAVTSCEEWRRKLNEGEYGYVVATPSVDIWEPLAPGDVHEIAWTRSDTGTELILDTPYADVFRILRPLDPATCGQGA